MHLYYRSTARLISIVNLSQVRKERQKRKVSGVTIVVAEAPVEAHQLVLEGSPPVLGVLCLAPSIAEYLDTKREWRPHERSHVLGIATTNLMHAGAS